MAEAFELWEQPVAERIDMIAGWRQWADAGSVSSGLLHYLIQKQDARPLGEIKPDGFYLFQIPGTHDLVRPEIRLKDGYPETLNTPRNRFFYSGDAQHGMVYFIGDEPHLDAERYTTALLDAARQLNVRRIVGFGGVYGELPYDKERMVSAIYSLPQMQDEISQYSVSLSNYHGGASIESYICRRAGERAQEFVALYAFVPTYDFSSLIPDGKSIRIENDFMAWLGIMQRVSHMLHYGFDLADLEKKSRHLVELMDGEIKDIEASAPQFDVRAYLSQLSENFTEMPFTPLDSFWEEKLQGLFDKMEDEEPDEPDEPQD